MFCFSRHPIMRSHETMELPLTPLRVDWGAYSSSLGLAR